MLILFRFMLLLLCYFIELDVYLYNENYDLFDWLIMCDVVKILWKCLDFLNIDKIWI